MLSPSTKNLTLGKGILSFDMTDPNTGLAVGERDLGNAPSVNFNVTLEALEHFTSRGGLKSKDKKIISQVTPKFTFSLDELNADNLALLFMSEVTDESQSAEDGLSLALTSVSPGLYYDLPRREIGITALAYDGGTVDFIVGEIVSGATGIGTVVQVIGTTTVGTLYIKAVTVGFVDDEALTGDGTGAAVVNGTEAFLDTAVSVEDTDATGTFFIAGTDYILDSTTGRILIVAGGAINGTTVLNLTVAYEATAATWKQINGLSNTELEGRFRFVSDNPVGNQYEMEIWKVSLMPTGDLTLIGDDWSILSFEGEVLKDEADHSTNPYMRIIVTEQA